MELMEWSLGCLKEQQKCTKIFSHERPKTILLFLLITSIEVPEKCEAANSAISHGRMMLQPLKANADGEMA